MYADARIATPIYTDYFFQFLFQRIQFLIYVHFYSIFRKITLLLEKERERERERESKEKNKNYVL